MTQWKRLLTYDELDQIQTDGGSDAYRIINKTFFTRIMGTDRNEVVFLRSATNYHDSTLVSHKYGTGNMDQVKDVSPKTFGRCAFWYNPWGTIVLYYAYITITSNRSDESHSAGYDFHLYQGDSVEDVKDIFGDVHYETGVLTNVLDPGNFVGGADWPDIDHVSGRAMIAEKWLPFNFFTELMEKNQQLFLAIKERDGDNLGSMPGGGTVASVSVTLSIVYNVTNFEL